MARMNRSKKCEVRSVKGDMRRRLLDSVAG